MKKGEFSSGEVVPGTRYRVLGLLGAGGMGLVYEVEHLELGKRFVLKALMSDLAGRDDVTARLRNEQRLLGRLQHPNIVTVTDAGVTSTGIPFFVMEHLDGETLGARLRRSRRLPVIEAIEIARGVLSGLSAAHEVGVVHRDIKPQNIFLVHGGAPKVLDFGVAKIADTPSVITARGVAIGTPRYMSPEQVAGERVDGRSDLYAVGLVLFEAIAGAGPFDDVREANEMLLAHLGRPAPSLAQQAAGVSRELDALVRSLLAKSPAERPPNAHAAAAALAVVAGSYAQSARFEASTGLSGDTSVTVLGNTANSLPTRPDGIAAREAPTTFDPRTPSGTTQILAPGISSGAAAPASGLRGPGGTLYDPSSRALTVMRPVDAELPADALRTEFLPDAIPAPAGDDPTRTRVPLTPTDGTGSLVAVRAEGPSSRRAVPLARWVAIAGIVAVAAGTIVLASFGSKPSGVEESTVTSPTEQREAAASRPAGLPPEPADSAVLRTQEPVPVVSAAPSNGPQPMSSAAGASAAPRAPAGLASTATPSAKVPAARPEPVSPRPAPSQRKPKATASGSGIPFRLPSSGL